MNEKKKMKQEKIDCFEQKLAQKLSEELSSIQVSEELIQRTLQAASGRAEDYRKAEETEGIKKNRERRKRLHLLQGCSIAAAALLVMFLGFRSIRFSMKSDSGMEGNPSAGEEENWNDKQGIWNGIDSSGGHPIDNAGKSEASSDVSGEGAAGNMEMDGSAQAPQGVPTSYPEEWEDNLHVNEPTFPADAEEEGNKNVDSWDGELPNNTDGVQNKAEEAEKEKLISQAVSDLLLDVDETAGIVQLDGFTEAEGMDLENPEEAYREFFYASEEDMLEITARVYPDGRLEGKLVRPGGIMYKAVTGTPGTKRLWKILDNNE